uniref:C-type lectin domain-containing protein n=1 Tax=Panagrolaimus sp. ES5 TaxID=591445 RepID=A0AC34GRD1_9BILA
MVADKQCRTMGGNLVSIHDTFENVDINGQAYTIFTESTDIDFWIGANDFQSTDKWSWCDNTNFDFSSWDKGQPQNSSGPLCVSSMMNGAKWSAKDCFIAKPYVCEVKAAVCSEGWKYFKSTDFCYKLIQHAANWSHAEKLCVNENAHLASLHSYDEALFVTYLASNISSNKDNTCVDYDQTWIGLSTPDNNTSWEWTDGTPFDYKNWGMNEPDASGIQNCVVMWIRQPCSDLNWDAAPTEWDNLQCKRKILNNVCKKARNL